MKYMCIKLVTCIVVFITIYWQQSDKPQCFVFNFFIIKAN